MAILHQAKRTALDNEQQVRAISTWRYLRLALFALALGLLAAVLDEVRAVGWECVQTSISAYAYTPVRGALTAALIGIGVCLFCLKGNTDLEDLFLNAAGVFAAVVALVPMRFNPGEHACRASSGVPRGTIAEIADDRALGVANNGVALVVVLAASVVLLVLLRTPRPPTRTTKIGTGVSLVLAAAATVVFARDRDDFLQFAHVTAAGGLFLFITLAVLNNAYRQPGHIWSLNRYTVTAGVMLTLTAVTAVVAWRGWDYWIIFGEGTFIGTFAVFWGLQSQELWKAGIADTTDTDVNAAKTAAQEVALKAGDQAAA